MDQQPRLKKTKSLDRDNYVPMYLLGLANTLSRGASKIYLRLFGVGIIEWRILSILSNSPDITANDICARIDLDKAAASRSVKFLEQAGYITLTVDTADNRRKFIVMTETGAALHDEIIEIALFRQRRLLEGFTPAERSLLMEFLHRLQRNVVDIDDYDYESLTQSKKGRGSPPRLQRPNAKG